MTELWFESILATTRTRNRAGEHLGYVALTEGEEYHYIKPTGKQIQGFKAWLMMDEFRKPCLGT
ncbi:MAG: hypothetical protein ABSA12_10430 [Verrucomicrobiia bacterium]|jgi:hypothetical protein